MICSWACEKKYFFRKDFHYLRVLAIAKLQNIRLSYKKRHI